MKFKVTIISLLAAMASAAFAQEGVPFFTQDFPPEEFAQRRAAIYDEIGPGAIALIQGEPSPEGFVRFRQSNEFYYLCGIESPHAYLLLDGESRTAALYLRHRNDHQERIEGKTISAEEAELVKQLSGIEAVYSIDRLSEHLQAYSQRKPPKIIFTPFMPAEGLAESRGIGIQTNQDIAEDPWDGRISREKNLIDLLKSRLAVQDVEYLLKVEDLSPMLDKMRLIKSPREIEMIRKATRLSGLGLMEAMRSSAPGVYEYELDSAARYVYLRNGAQGDAYYSIVASGPNAWFPHYHANKRRMEDGDLVLMDYAPDYGYYMSDLTRTWPVNGKFSPDQRDLYQFYIDCYKAILKRIRPHVNGATVFKEAVAEMEEIVAKASFSKDIYKKAAETFVEVYRRLSRMQNASLGHWVGMATHDVGGFGGELKPGMVFTIEPQFIVPEERIYIRSEDLIVITETGADVLSDFVPMDIDGIENLMKEEGILQRYPMDQLFSH